MSTIRKIFLLLVLVSLSACVADRGDRTNMSYEKYSALYENGAIFKSGINERPLYEDRRARNVGDGLVMNVVDAFAGNKKPAAKPEGAAAKDGKDSKDGKSEEEDRRRRSTDGEEGSDLTNISSDSLLGIVPMTVLEVLGNGKLLVTGGRQVTLDEDSKYLRVTGVLDPAFITNGNTIQSSQLTDVHISIDHVRLRADGSSSRINEGNSIFGNYFQSINPR